MIDQDILKRAYAVLVALKENLPPKSFHIHEKYVQEYHAAIGDLEKQRLDLKQFKIPESEIERRLASYNGMSGESTYSDDRYVERAFLMTKLDALLSYFSLSMDERKPRIGFSQGR